MKGRRGRPSTLETRLPDVPPSEAWKALALCARMDSEMFFDLTTPDAVRQARSVCELCPVSSPCLEYAITWKEGWGMWGGHTPREREHIVVLRGLQQRGLI